MCDDAIPERPPELRDEIAVGKLPQGYDPLYAAYAALYAAYRNRVGPFRLSHLRPPTHGGMDADFATRLSTIRTAVATGDVMMQARLHDIGLGAGHLSRALEFISSRHKKKVKSMLHRMRLGPVIRRAGG